MRSSGIGEQFAEHVLAKSGPREHLGVEHLQLQQGDQVTVIIKATEVLIGK